MSTILNPSNDISSGLEVTGIVLSIGITIALSFLEGKKKGKRLGLVIPINFLHDDHLAYIYASAFGCASTEFLLNILFQQNIISYSIPRLVYPWIRILVWLLNALLTSVKYYPIFAVITCKQRLIEPVVGLCYTAFVFGVFIYNTVFELSAVRSEIQHIDASIVAYLPVFVCFVTLLIYFMYRILFHLPCLREKHDFFFQTENRCASHHQEKYVKWLLQRPDRNFRESTETSSSVLARARKFQLDRLKEKMMWHYPLRTSPRVIATFTMTMLVLYQLGFALLVTFAISMPKIRANMLNALVINGTSVYKESFTIFCEVLEVGFYLSFVTSCVIMVIYLAVIFINYRKDLQKMPRGDYSFLPMKLRKTLNDNLVAASFRYSGSQIAFLMWLYLLMIIGVWLACFLVAYIIILPLAGKVPLQLFEPVALLLPIILINLGFRKGQVFLSRTFFLQNHTVEIKGTSQTQKALALDNIKTYNVLTYFFFFFYSIIGFFGSIRRIMTGAVIGVMSLGRIDKCMLPRGWEKYDRDYSTYIGMLMVELYHRNPVLTVFCDLLLSSSRFTTNTLLKPVESEIQHRHRRVFRRWQKTYTLINNPLARVSVDDHSITKDSVSNINSTSCDINDVQIAI